LNKVLYKVAKTGTDLFLVHKRIDKKQLIRLILHLVRAAIGNIHQLHKSTNPTKQKTGIKKLKLLNTGSLYYFKC